MSSHPCLYDFRPTTRTSQRRQSPRRADDMRCSWLPDGSDGCGCCARALWPINASTPRTTTLHKQVALPSVMSRPVRLACPGEDRPSDLPSADSRERTATPIATSATYHRLEPLPPQLLSSQVREPMTHAVYYIMFYYSILCKL